MSYTETKDCCEKKESRKILIPRGGGWPWGQGPLCKATPRSPPPSMAFGALAPKGWPTNPWGTIVPPNGIDSVCTVVPLCQGYKAN